MQGPAALRSCGGHHAPQSAFVDVQSHRARLRPADIRRGGAAMSESRQAGLKSWLTEPLAPEIVKSVDRLRQLDDVQHVALMPDVHLAQDVCIGAVVATRQLIYPAAVGGDIGCGMVALAFDVDAASVDNERAAA